MKKRTSDKRTSWTSAASRRLMSMTGTSANVEDAVRIIVNRILEGISSPPTDLEAIKSRLDITGFYSEDLPVSGELRRDGNCFKIVYSSYLSPERRRFTIAHEMGHALFATSGRNWPRFGSELERLCNMLATEILMPRDIFHNLMGPELSIRKLFELARTFATSLSATAIRFAELRRVSTFEVEGKNVSWSYGVVRRGNLRGIEDGLRYAIEEALTRKSGEELVYLNNRIWTGEWRLEWAHIGQGRRALFLLQPIDNGVVRDNRDDVHVAT